MILSLFFACKAPVEAPTDLNELLAYIYQHTMDTEEEELLAGLQNLAQFTEDNRDALIEGYTVTPLTAAAIETTGTEALYIDEQYGVSLLYEVPYPVEDLVYCNTIINGSDVYVDDYISYERTHLSDVNCFLDQTCTTLRFRSTILSSLPMGAEMLTDYINELRWIELDAGTAVIQRSWMEGEPETSASWANMLASYYIGITYSTPQGTDTVAASWAALLLGDLPLPEDVTKNQALDALRRNGTDLTNYLNENDISN
ncbi:MAG: hypothetical protein VX278_00175 [Myxococcota bacterium]|nr:hypothetical protein [Myxococcota bacterium]